MSEQATLRVLDLMGRCVRELPVSAGTLEFQLPADSRKGPFLRLVSPTGNTAAYWLNVE